MPTRFLGSLGPTRLLMVLGLLVVMMATVTPALAHQENGHGVGGQRLSNGLSRGLFHPASSSMASRSIGNRPIGNRSIGGAPLTRSQLTAQLVSPPPSVGIGYPRQQRWARSAYRNQNRSYQYNRFPSNAALQFQNSPIYRVPRAPLGQGNRYFRRQRAGYSNDVVNGFAGGVQPLPYPYNNPIRTGQSPSIPYHPALAPFVGQPWVDSPSRHHQHTAPAPGSSGYYKITLQPHAPY